MSAQKTPEPPTRGPDPGEEEPESEPSERLTFDLIKDGGDWSRLADPQKLIGNIARVLIDAGSVDSWLPAVGVIALSNDASVQRLNRNYRNKDAPTNVLSFPTPNVGLMAVGPRMLGDIILADDVVARESAELGIPFAHHFQHLVVHGALHLMGYDHETDDDAAVMERLETALLARLGIADPYAPID